MSAEEGVPKIRRTISPVLLRPRPMELGKIKIGGRGEKKTTVNDKQMGLPVKFDHFVITGRKRGQDGNFLPDEHIHEKLGPAPEELEVRFMFDNLTDNFQSEMVIYTGKKKVFACDGENAFNLAKGSHGPCLRDSEKGCKCKPSGRLAVILERAAQYGGFYLFRTSS